MWWWLWQKPGDLHKKSVSDDLDLFGDISHFGYLILRKLLLKIINKKNLKIKENKEDKKFKLNLIEAKFLSFLCSANEDSKTGKKAFDEWKQQSKYCDRVGFNAL